MLYISIYKIIYSYNRKEKKRDMSKSKSLPSRRYISPLLRTNSVNDVADTSNPRSEHVYTGDIDDLYRTLDSVDNSLYTTPKQLINGYDETIQATKSYDYDGPIYDGTIQATKSIGGKYSKNVYKKVGKKDVLGKDRVIYKMKGSNKEYLKTKGMYIPVSEYKKLKKIK
jgi:hypothetical protein